MTTFLTRHWMRLLVALPLLSLSVGCSQKINDVSATVQEAYNSYIDIELSADEINAVPYASAYLKIGDQKQVFVVLAFAEQNPMSGKTQMKWVSADKAMIVTENGHIVKTVGLQHQNLAGTYNPIPAFSQADTDFTLSYDWQQQYRYGFPAQVTRTYQGQETVTTPISTRQTDVYRESVHFPTLSSSVDNYYWVDAQGQVVKTLQYLGPNMPALELTILKGYSQS